MHLAMSDRIILSDVTHLLIATSSILIDRSLQSNGTRDRICCQVWLWLAASLSNHGERSSSDSLPSISLVETWVHAVLFSNIIPIVVGRSIVEQEKPPRQSTRRNGFAAGATNESDASPKADPNGAELVCSLLAPSAWISLATTICIVHHPTPDPLQQLLRSQQRFSLLIFLFSFFILWGIQWRQRLRRRRDAHLKGIPVSNPSQYSKSSGCCGVFTSTTSAPEMTLQQPTQYGYHQESQLPDEYVWYTWSPAQVLQWVSHIIKEQKYNDDPTLQQETIISTLSTHHISGRILDHLSLSELRSLNIPYGPACEISIQIHILVSNHPKPNVLQDIAASHSSSASVTPLETKLSSATADCLTLHDKEYNSSKGAAQPLDSRYTGKELLTAMLSGKERVLPSPSSVETPHVVDDNTDESAQQKVQEIMKDRFGLELPALRISLNEAASDASKRNSKMGYMPEPEQRTAPSEAPISSSGLFRSSHLSGAVGTSPNVAMTNNRSGPTSTQQPVKTTDILNKLLPEEVRKDMPPHILQIAQRNPDVVQHLIIKKQQQRLVRQSPKEYPNKSYQQANNAKPVSLLVESNDPSRFSREFEVHRHSALDADIYDEPSTTPLTIDPLQGTYSIPNSSNTEDERTNLLQHRKQSSLRTRPSKSSNYWAIDPS